MMYLGLVAYLGLFAACFNLWKKGLRRLAYFLAGSCAILASTSIYEIGATSDWWEFNFRFFAFVSGFWNLGFLTLAGCVFLISRRVKNPEEDVRI